ncbi:MAG: hypothetical protein NTY23_08550 [Chloroflexi bacterium]|nr:hypothetical protein [Chloroflexota bacterium]
MLENTELMAVIISLVSLGVSVYVERRAARLSDVSFRRTAEHDHISALLELDRVLIANPVVWAICGDHPLARGRQAETEGWRPPGARPSSTHTSTFLSWSTISATARSA